LGIIIAILYTRKELIRVPSRLLCVGGNLAGEAGIFRTSQADGTSFQCNDGQSLAKAV
jgi:hypothetical protein